MHAALAPKEEESSHGVIGNLPLMAELIKRLFFSGFSTTSSLNTGKPIRMAPFTFSHRFPRPKLSSKSAEHEPFELELCAFGHLDKKTSAEIDQNFKKLKMD